MRSLLCLVPAALLTLVGCSDADDLKPSTPAGTARPTTQVETWQTGKKLSGTTEVAFGTTVEIAPGANISCAPGATVLVRGTLRVRAGSNHAKISCNTWTGIVVAEAGILAADGLDLENADTGIATTGDGSEAALEHGSILGSQMPFSVGVATKLSLVNTKVVAKGQSEVMGDLYASRMAYDKGAGEGIVLGHEKGTIVIEDSVLTGTGNRESVQSQKGKFVKVSYTTISGAHCAFHFDSVGGFEIDHVTTDASVFAVMFYGSNDGGKVSYSNLVGQSVDLDIQGTNGKIELDHVYTNGKEQVKGTAPVVTNRSSAAIADAKPR